MTISAREISNGKRGKRDAGNRLCDLRSFRLRLGQSKTASLGVNGPNGRVKAYFALEDSGQCTMVYECVERLHDPGKREHTYLHLKLTHFWV